jgi:hypothetical protein
MGDGDRIQGMTPRDYAFTWASGGCPFQQWASGAVGVTPAVIEHAERLHDEAADPADRDGLAKLAAWLRNHAGDPASPYTPGD